jgi:hypothetical protein
MMKSRRENNGFHILQLHNACLCAVNLLKPLGFAMMSCWWGPSNVAIFVKI